MCMKLLERNPRENKYFVRDRKRRADRWKDIQADIERYNKVPPSRKHTYIILTPLNPTFI